MELISEKPEYITVLSSQSPSHSQNNLVECENTDEEVSYNDILEAFKRWSRDPRRIAMTFMRVMILLFLLYFFLFFLDLMGTSFKVLGSCEAGDMFSGLDNPIAGLMVGILATVCIQSSSTSTSIVVSLVGSGNMKVHTAIPVIMGANIGTSVTNTIVSMFYIAQADNLERAFAGATVHDCFNILSVIVLLPFELIFHPLYHLSNAMTPDNVDDGEKWEGPLKKLVGPFVSRIIIANKEVMTSIAQEETSCEDVYATHERNVDDGVDYVTGLIKASCKSTYFSWVKDDECDDRGDIYIVPVFYDDHSSLDEDMAAAGVSLFISIVGLCSCMILLVKLLSYISRTSTPAMLKKAAYMPGVVAIAVGTAITILVQSSSVTTSVLTPLVAADIISLEQMLPLTLGANIGTTCTALLASLVSDNVDAVQIALCHLLFNVFGILIWYPIPFMRRMPIRAALLLGKCTQKLKIFPILYIIVMFFLIPGTLFGISSLFGGPKAYEALGVMIIFALFAAIVYFVHWLKKRDGISYLFGKFKEYNEKKAFYSNLQKDFEDMKSRLAELEGNTDQITMDK